MANTGHFQQECHSCSNLTCRHHNHWPALPGSVHEQPGKCYQINKAQPVNIGKKEPAGSVIQGNDRSIEPKAAPFQAIELVK